MIQARTLTSEAEMRANAVAVRARCFYPKAAPKPQPSQVVTLISYRGYEPPKPPAPVTPPSVPAWQTTPTMFEEHVFAYRAAVKIQEMIAAGEIELVNIERRTVSQIVDEVLREFPGITVQALKGRSRTVPVIAARHAAIYAVKMERADMSYPAIGKWFGLDHTSILHCVRKIKAQKEASA